MKLLQLTMTGALIALILSVSACQLKENNTLDEKTIDDDMALMVSDSLARSDGEDAQTMDDAVDEAVLNTGINGKKKRTLHGSNFQGSLDFDYTYTYSDCDDDICDTLNLVGIIEGSFTSERRNRTVYRVRNLLLTGISGDKVTINGTGSGDVSGDFSGKFYNYTRTYKISRQLTFTNIVIAKDREANPYPLSGTLSITASGERTVDSDKVEKNVSFTRDILVTFNGTETPTVTMNGERNYTINLTNGEVTTE